LRGGTLTLIKGCDMLDSMLGFGITCEGLTLVVSPLSISYFRCSVDLRQGSSNTSDSCSIGMRATELIENILHFRISPTNFLCLMKTNRVARPRIKKEKFKIPEITKYFSSN